MAEGRMLKKKISLSRRLADLKTDTSRMFYTWLLAHLDIEGRFSANPDILKGLIVPRLKHITPTEIEEIIQDLARVDLITLYSYDGDRYLEYRAFEKNQTLRKDRERASEILKADANSRITPGELQDIDGITPPQVKLSKDKIREEEQLPFIFCSVILRDKTYFDITEEKVKEYENTYPNMDVRQELIRLRQWNIDNDAKRKTRRGFLGHVNKWLGGKKDKEYIASAPEPVNRTGEKLEINPRHEELMEQLVKGVIKKVK